MNNYKHLLTNFGCLLKNSRYLMINTGYFFFLFIYECRNASVKREIITKILKIIKVSGLAIQELLSYCLPDAVKLCARDSYEYFESFTSSFDSSALSIQASKWKSKYLTVWRPSRVKNKMTTDFLVLTPVLASYNSTYGYRSDKLYLRRHGTVGTSGRRHLPMCVAQPEKKKKKNPTPCTLNLYKL